MNEIVDIGKLTKLRNDTDAVISEIEHGDPINEAINWADLRCVEARCVLTDQGDQYLEVIIEEASPDAAKLQDAIRGGLERKGWEGVVVVTEW